MNFDQLRRILFEDSEMVYIGDQYGTTVTTQYKRGAFFCINPLSGTRADNSVTALRNLLFELDTGTLEEQLQALEPLKPYLASIVYSGGKSYHAIVSLEYPLPGAGTTTGINAYKGLWRALSNKFAELSNGKLKFDPSCQNPSRLTRYPGWHRNGIEQKMVYLGNILTVEKLHKLLPTGYGEYVPKQINRATTEVQKFESLEKLKMNMPTELQNKLLFAKKWAEPQNMYPVLFKLAMWAIDSTGVTESQLLEFMQKYTFPALIEVGYPKEKLEKPIRNAYEHKFGK